MHNVQIISLHIGSFCGTAEICCASVRGIMYVYKRQGMSSCSEIRTREPHIGQMCAVCAAADRKDKGCNARCFAGVFCLLDEIRIFLNAFSHIPVFLF